MKKKAIAAIIVTVLLLSVLALAFNVERALAHWDVLYSADELPDEADPVWILDETFEGTGIAAVAEGTLGLDTTSEDQYWFYKRSTTFDNSIGSTVEARLRVESADLLYWGQISIVICDGTKVEILCLREDRIAAWHSGLYHDMDTTDDFHAYSIVAKGSDFKVFVDGKLRIDGTGEYTTTTSDNLVAFGDIESTSGEEGAISQWDYVAYTAQEMIYVIFGSTPTEDGIISPGEWDDANSVTFPTSGGTCTVYLKHDGTTLYVAFDVPNLDADSAVQIFVDTSYDRASAPQPDDYRFTIARREDPNEYGENQGTGTTWTAWGPPVGWTGAHEDLASTWNAEFTIPYGKLGITAAVAKTLGIAFCNAWTSTGDHWWPDTADWLDPSTWGTASSSDNWGYAATIEAYCLTEGAPLSVPIIMNGLATGTSTPQTFTGLAGTNTFAVPGLDTCAITHPFKQWSTGATTVTVTVTSGGTYTAYYQARHTLTISTDPLRGTTTPVPGTYTYWEGTPVSVTANPLAGFALCYWELDGTRTSASTSARAEGAYHGTANPTTVLMDKDHTIYPIFITAPSPPVMRVGVIGPMGTPQFDGMVEGAALAADWINGPGGGVVIDGTRYDVSLHFGDEHSFPTMDPAAAALEMTRLITVEQVDVVIGGYRTECTSALREVAMDYQKLFFICGSATNELIDCGGGAGACGACVRCDYSRYKYTFRATPINNTMLVYNILGFLRLYVLPYRLAPLYGSPVRTAVIAEDLAWTVLPYNAFVFGGYLGPQANIVYSARTPYTPGSPYNFASDLAAMHAAQVRLIVHLYSTPDGLAFISQMAAHPIKAVPVGINALSQTGLTSEYETILAASGSRNPLSTVSLPYPTTQVSDLYWAWFVHAPIDTSWGVYDAIIALHDMLEGQTAITPPFDTADANALVPLLEATDREGVLGRFKFTQYHDPFSNEYGATWEKGYVRPLVVQWQAGRLEVVWPADPDTGTPGSEWARFWSLPDESNKMYPYPQDVDQDGYVGFWDAMFVRNAFGGTAKPPDQPLDPKWFMVANCIDPGPPYPDDLIDLYDALYVSNDYGKAVALPLAYCNEAGHLS